MKSYYLLAMTMTLALVFSCKDTISDTASSDHSRIYFEREYVNFAWGYVHFGWFIDSSGQVISYDIAKSGDRWVANPSGYYTEEQLWIKIHHMDTLRSSVPADTLQFLRGLAQNAVAGTSSDTICAGADMGAHSYSCYVFQADSSKFRRIVLRVEGDCSYHNTSQSAITLATWMAQR